MLFNYKLIKWNKTKIIYIILNKSNSKKTLHKLNLCWAEYNTNGKKIKTMNELLEENENNIKKYNIVFKSESQNKSLNKSINNLNNNIR